MPDLEMPMPIHILSTRALGNAARDFIHHKDWLVDMVSMIETHGVLTIEQIEAFLKDCEIDGENIMLLFSSENGVKWLKWGLDKFGYKMPKGLKAVCVGEKTVKTAVDCLGIEAILVEKSSTELLAALLLSFSVGTTFHFFCGNKRLDTLPKGLSSSGFEVKEYLIYHTVPTPHKIFRNYDAILFFSPSAVESFFLVNEWRTGTVAVSIGLTTSQTLRKSGVENTLVAAEQNETAMMAAMHQYFLLK
jgi:uroporphyrinogen-III synthase